MHPLYDVATVIEDAPDVFRVDRAGEVGVTVMPPVPTGCADPLEKDTNVQLRHFQITISITSHGLKMGIGHNA